MQISSNPTKKQKTVLFGYNNKSILGPLYFIWAIILLFGEILIFNFELKNCPWPERQEWKQIISKTSHKPIKIALIADPQIIDRYSYNRSPWLIRLTQFITDQYMFKSWKNVQKFLHPDAYVFVGDLMDGGREWEHDRDWMNEMIRFKKLFHLNSDQPIFYLAGNHDVGFGDTIVPKAQERFRSYFGNLNYQIDIGNHSLIMVDTTTLGSRNPNIRKDSLTFIKQIGQTTPYFPRILFSHVPLWRPPLTSCGLKRQTSKSINQGIGYQYQNILFEQESTLLLRHIRPQIIFTGDDHDYCEINHKLKYSDSHDIIQVTEIAINTFSFAMGISKPGFQLLTLFNPDALSPGLLNQFQTFDTNQCLLPNQMKIFSTYFLLVIPTAFILLFHSYWKYKISISHLPLFKRKIDQHTMKSRYRNSFRKAINVWKSPIVWQTWIKDCFKLLSFSIGMFAIFSFYFHII